MNSGCGLIKDWKTRYYLVLTALASIGCGLIKDWKTRYLRITTPELTNGCGLIKDWKTRYLDDNNRKPIVVVV